MSDNWRAIWRSALGTFAAIALLFTPACCPNAHQVAQAPATAHEPCPAPATPPPPPPPPPPPKCDTLQERCEATSETRVAIGENTASFQPPATWVYAKEEAQSLTMSPDHKAWLAFAQIDTDDQKLILSTVEHLTARLQIDKVRSNLLKDRLKKPQHRLQEGAFEAKLWEVDKKSQFGTEPVLNGTEPGTVLVLVIPVDAKSVLVGTAFVTAEQSDAYAPVVMKSVQSLAPVGSAGGQPAAAATPVDGTDRAPQSSGQ